MFTYKTHNDEVIKELRSRTVTAVFTDGNRDVSQTFRFPIGTTDEEVKRAVKVYLDELNIPHVPLSGDITDVEPEPAPVELTQAEKDRNTWQNNREKLRNLMELVRDGVFTGDEKQITDLQTRVKTDFKPAYLD